MVSISYSTLLGAGIPTFVTGITDLDIAWINGTPRLYAATRPAPGAGYSVFDISTPGSAAPLVAVQGYGPAIHPDTTPAIDVIASGTSGFLFGSGLAPSGWASYGLSAQGGFGATLNTPLPFDPTAVTSLVSASRTYVFFTPENQPQPVSYHLAANGAMTPAFVPQNLPAGPSVDSMSVAQTADGTFLLTASAAGDVISSYAVAANGGLTLVGQVAAVAGIGFSRPTTVDNVTLHGITYAVAAGAQSSSLSVFRLLPAGQFYAADHVVDNLATHFAGATAMATLQLGSRAFVMVGGAEDGIDVMTMLPDGRLIHLLSVADTAALTLADVTCITATQVSTHTEVFVASATEPGITQLDIDLGPMGVSLFKDPGVQQGTANNDLLFAGAGTTALYGGGGDDILVAGGPGGGAVLYGGAGRDIFVLSPSDTTLEVADYQVGIDRLDLTSMPGLRNLGQLTMTQTASGMDIAYLTTTIHVESADGNPIAPTAFAQSQMLPFDRFPPVTTTTIQFGGSGNDFLTATSEDTSLVGLSGNDRLTGGTGNDALEGDGGNDTLFGADGNDRLTGDLGNDWLYGGAGNDSIDAGAGNDLVYGGTGDDTITGGDGADSLYGDDGNDTVSGGDGNDLVAGATGDDLLYGGNGNDNVWGGLGNDSLYGDAGNDTLHGVDGADLLDGGSGNDLLYGDAGNDTISGGDGNDLLAGATGDDLLYGGNGNDNVWGGLGNDSLHGDAGNDTLHGADGADLLDGGAGNDLLYGENGNDTLTGGGGADSLYGGAGADLFVYRTPSDMGTAQTSDEICDFQPGTDKLSFTGMHTHLGAANGFSGQPNELRYTVAGSVCTVWLDVDGDKIADYSIRLDGVHSLAPSDFIL